MSQGTSAAAIAALGHVATRADVRVALKLERKALKTGDWGEWEFGQTPAEIDGGRAFGWPSQVRQTIYNRAFVVLIRDVHTEWGIVKHAAIRNASGTDISWAHKQRIKNEIFGSFSVAVEVFPRTDELVDAANMYHLWVLPHAFTLPFTLATRP